MIKINLMKKNLFNLIFFNFVIIFVLAIFFFYLSSQGKILNKNTIQVDYIKKYENNLCDRIVLDDAISSIRLDKEIIFDKTSKALKNEKSFKDILLKIDFEYLDIVNAAIGTNNHLLTKTTISKNYKLDRINAVFSFNEKFFLNKDKIEELIQIFNLEFNNQIKIYLINELKKNSALIQKLIKNEELNDNQILKLENEKFKIENALENNLLLNINNLCNQKLDLVSYNKKKLMETQRLIYFNSSVLIILILNLLIIIVIILKKND